MKKIPIVILLLVKLSTAGELKIKTFSVSQAL